MDKLLQGRWLMIAGIIGLLSIFTLLFYRSPYSERTLIGNLEPYPDTLFYSQPAWNLMHGQGYVMQAYGFETKIVTPPVYSLYLAPFFAVFNDVRIFYGANIILALISLWLLLASIRALFFGTYGIFPMILGGFLYLTNYYIFTLPTLLMAENITLTLFLLLTYLLVQKITKKNAGIAGIAGILLLGVKFSNLPLVVGFYILYAWRIYKEKAIKSIYMERYVISAVAAGVLFVCYIFFSKILIGHKNLGTTNSFGGIYLLPNLYTYIRTLLGNPASFLWFYYPMVSPLIGILSFVGAGIGLMVPQFRKPIGYMLFLTILHILFGSFFYATDSRYIIVLYPLMILFFIPLWHVLLDRFSLAKALGIMAFIMVCYVSIPLFGQIPSERLMITLKKQVGINYRHAEVPWHMIAVKEWHTFARNQKEKVYIATFLPPYFVHYYAGDDIYYLPATAGQEFFYDKTDQSNNYALSLADYYTSLLKQGNKLYISSYYSTNVAGWDAQYNELVSNFNIELAQAGCMGVCSLYELTLSQE